MRKSGKTLPAIAKKLKVSKSSVSLWTQDIVLPERARALIQARKVRAREMANEAKRKLTRTKLANVKQESELSMSKTTIDNEMALIMCSLMYWCEGSKSKNDSEFTFTNAEPLTICGFMALLRQAIPQLDEKRFRVKMHLHEYHDESRQRTFWSEVTGIQEQQFQNTFWKPHTGKSTKPNYNGCIHVRYHDVVLSRKISAIARAFLENMVT